MKWRYFYGYFCKYKKKTPKLIAISAFCYPLLFQSIDVLAQTRPPPPEPPREETRAETRRTETEPETRRTEGETRPGIGGRPTQEQAIRQWVAGQPPQVEAGRPSAPRNPNVPLRLEPATPPSVGYRPPPPGSLQDLGQLRQSGNTIIEYYPGGRQTYRVAEVRDRLNNIPSSNNQRLPPPNPPGDLPTEYHPMWNTYYQQMLNRNNRPLDYFYEQLNQAYWNGTLFQFLGIVK